jgi:hypothetical protein
VAHAGGYPIAAFAADQLFPAFADDLIRSLNRASDILIILRLWAQGTTTAKSSTEGPSTRPPSEVIDFSRSATSGLRCDGSTCAARHASRGATSSTTGCAVAPRSAVVLDMVDDASLKAIKAFRPTPSCRCIRSPHWCLTHAEDEEMRVPVVTYLTDFASPLA